MTAPDLRGAGTPEAVWRDSGRLAALPAATARDVLGDGPVVVVAPHPDDEVLGAGGVLAATAGDGREVTVLALTRGEGSHPGSPTLAPVELAARRRGERRDALAVLGHPQAGIVELDLPDGGVTDHERAVREAVAALLDEAPDASVLAPRRGDGHPDHDAAARAAAAACVGGRGRPVGYGVWFWHWATPEPAGLDGAVRVELPEAARRAKRAAVACFATQVAPLSPDPRDAAVLPPPVLERLLRDREVFW